MQLRTRDFITSRDSPDVDQHPQDHTDGFTDYKIKKVNGPLDLTKGPIVIISMGVMQTDDAFNCTAEEAKQTVNSGSMPYTKRFMDDMFPNQDAAVGYGFLTEGLDRMCRGYFRYADEVFCRPTLPLDPSTYVMSFRSVEERMKSLYDFKTADQNSFYTDEAVDFVLQAMVPSMGAFKEAHGADGKRIIEITERKSTQDIVKCFENIMFLGNSSGVSFLTEIENVLRSTMQQSHFPDKDIKEIMRAVRAVGVGQLTDFKNLKGPRFTSVYFEGINDLVAEKLNPHKVVVTEQEIRKYCPPEQQEKLIAAAQEHYETTNQMLNNPAGGLDGNRSALSGREIFMPKRGPEDNRMLVLSSTPTTRERWAISHWAQRLGRSNPQTERFFKELLEGIGKDSNGHHIALHLTQGVPPYYLVALLHKICHNMLIFTSLPEEEKKKYAIEDFMTQDWAVPRMRLDHDVGSARIKTTLESVVNEGLMRAAAYPHDNEKASASR